VCLERACQAGGDACAGLVLVGSAARLRVAPPVLATAAAAASPGGGPALPMDFAFAPGTAPEVLARYQATCQEVPAGSVLADWQACDAFDRRAALAAVTCPVLVLHGSDDLLTPPKHQGSLAGTLPQARRVEVEGAGHMLPWERPERVGAEAVDWVGQL